MIVNVPPTRRLGDVSSTRGQMSRMMLGSRKPIAQIVPPLPVTIVFILCPNASNEPLRICRRAKRRGEPEVAFDSVVGLL